MKLDRQARRHLLAGAHTAWVYSGPGIAEVTHQEIQELLPNLKTQADHRPGLRFRRDGAIITNIEYRQLLELTCRLTTAQEISLEIASSLVPAPASLDQLFARIRWPIFFRPGEGVALRIDSRGSAVYHEGLIRERMEAAMRKAGIVPRTPSEGEASGRLTVRIERDRGRVELSLVGAPLWQRGYRARLTATAPLREDLAQAALRRAAPWLTLGESPAPDLLLVPFCGTGTLLFEYLIARLSIPPLVFRSGYAFQSFACGTPDSIEWAGRMLVRELTARMEAAHPVRALLIDSSPPAIRMGKENLARFLSLVGSAAADAVAAGSASVGAASAGSETADSASAGSSSANRASVGVAAAGAGEMAARMVDPSWVVDDALSRPWKTRIPAGTRTVFIPLNPPYGKRLAVASAAELYRGIGQRCEELARALEGRQPTATALRGEIARLSGFILCPSEETWSSFSASCPSLRKATHHFTQGGIDVRLCLFTSAGEPAMIIGQ